MFLYSKVQLQTQHFVNRVAQIQSQTGKHLNHSIDGLSVRRITLDELTKTVYPWFPAVKTPGSEAATFHYPNGWYALAHENEPPVATLASMHKSNGATWLGWYYIVESLRKTGAASQLFHYVMEMDSQQGITTTSLQCFPTLEKLYTSYGFRTVYEDTIHRAKFTAPFKPELIGELPTAALTIDAFHKLLAYDKTVQCGLDRRIFLGDWLSKPGTEAIVAKNFSNEVVGYSVINPFYFECDKAETEHFRIAPLYAKTPGVAHELLERSIAVATQNAVDPNNQRARSVFIDTDGSNPAAKNLLASVGLFTPVVSILRMTRVAIPSQPEAVYYKSSDVYSYADYGSGP